MSAKPKKESWETLFDEKYLNTYIDTVTPELTAQQIPFLLEQLQIKKGDEILDLACGYGRHTIELARRGYKATGFDFSKHFIALAKKEAREQNVSADFIQGDMRSLPFVNQFDVIINMFTSFGYFDDENDNARVLGQVSRALRPDGKFLIDLNNPMFTLAPMIRDGKLDKKTGLLTRVLTVKLSNGLTVSNKFDFNPETMRWTINRTWEEEGKRKRYQMPIRLFHLPELKHLMEENALRVERVWGNFQGIPYGFETPRMIVLAKKW